MRMTVEMWLLVVMAVTFSDSSNIRATELIKCKFSNEGCDDDKECCSLKCLQAHPGTNARCTLSTLNDSCLYNYQCEDRLVCGSHNRCCSKYWGTCTKDQDCCLSHYRCLEAEGFYYKRCLMGQINHARGLPRVHVASRLGGVLLMVLVTRFLFRDVIVGGPFDVIL